jgi:hypothetical protein
MPKTITVTISSMRKSFKPAIISKIHHIINTAVRGGNITLGLGGVAHDRRTQWRFVNFDRWYKKNPMDPKAIERAFPNGLVIVLRNNDYFNIKDSTDPIHKLLVSRIGSNELLSAVVLIENEDSGKIKWGDLVKKVREFLGWKPLSKVNAQMKHTSTKDKTSNSYWNGHYAINLSGGTHTATKEGLIALANPIYDYASEYDSESIELQLMYTMLHCENAENLLVDPAKFAEVREKYRIECEKRSLADWTKFGDANPINKSGKLQCCIFRSKITADQFLGTCEDPDDAIQYCHISSKNEDDVTISLDGRVSTVFRPYNIAWGVKRANIAQQKMSIAQVRQWFRDSVAQLESP